ncbi:MAG: type IV toxin-antitoxin system AbiEi family antitoxin, partial [Lentimicrobiaceae bacterium]|nr:type IV toxin-antitoxin system AbiEi family antitoxin [Lentimicrobiaceae bacterium]
IEQGKKMNKKNELEVLKKIEELLTKTRWADKIDFKESGNNRIRIGNVPYYLEYMAKMDIGYIKHHRILKKHENIVYFRDYVPPAYAEQLISEKINFIDTTGNVYIQNNRIHIEITGKKISNKRRSINIRRRINPAAVKFIYLLLKDRNAINKTYRELAKEADIGYGGITQIVSNLKENNFIIEMNNKKKIINKNELFNRWVEGYLDNFAHKNILGRFRFNNEWTKFDPVDNKLAKWGGEIAANRMGIAIKPVEYILHVDKKIIKEVIETNMLLMAEDGNVVLKNKFWTSKERGDMVDVMLIYADLMTSVNQRDEEAAKTLYEKYIKEYLR